MTQPENPPEPIKFGLLIFAEGEVNKPQEEEKEET